MGMYLSIQFKFAKKFLNNAAVCALYDSRGLYLTRSCGVLGITLKLPV